MLSCWVTRLPISGDANAVTIPPGRAAATDHAGELRDYESKYRREGNPRTVTNDVKAAATESDTGSNGAKRVWRIRVQLSAKGRRLHRSWYR
jgi:hypothetical protein